MFRRKRLDSDFNAEVEAHIQLEAERLRNQGMPEAEARAAAQRAFGNVVRAHERFYESGRWLGWEHLRQDLRYALRMLAKNPGFTAIAVLTLGLGIGANTAIFSLIDAVILRFLPVAHPEELMQMRMRGAMDGSDGRSSYTNAIWEQVRDRQDVFAGAFAWSDDRFDLAQGGAVQNANGLFVSGGFFDTLQLRPAAGRLLAPSDDQPGCPDKAVLSYGFWEDHLGGDPRAIGGTIWLDHHPFEIVGVSAAGFSGLDVGSKFDVAVPICAAPIFDGKDSRLQHRSWWWLRIYGRVKPGLTEPQVNARLAILSPAILANSVPTDWPRGSQRDFLNSKLWASFAGTGVSSLRRQFKKPLYILMAIVALVLLIACSNIASLTLAQATARNKEIAVRQAMGASRWRLVRQLLTESMLLSAAGATLGILFARWGSALLVRYLSTGRNHVFLDLTPDLRVLGFTAAVAALTAILFGVLPALRATRVSLAAVMKGPGAEHRTRFHPAKWIVASQVALSLVLLVAAGLLLRSFAQLATLDAGFDRNNVLLVRVSLLESQIPVEQRPTTYRQIEAHLGALPGVLSVSRSWNTPISGDTWNQFITVDTPHPPTGEASLTDFNFISPAYFDTLRTGFLAGRKFSALDAKSAPRVAIVNQTLARKFFPGLDPLGHTFRIDPQPNQPAEPVQIVGVVKDSKYESLREETPPTAFFPITQMPGNAETQNFELRLATPPSSLATAVQSAVAQVNKGISLDLQSLAEQVSDSMIEERLLAVLSAFFGGLALLLATIGLYGTLSYLVTQRYTEFGIRIALGARSGMILRLVIRDCIAVVAGGVTAGLCLALATTRVLQQMLFGLGPRDAVTMIGAIAVLTTVALLAGWFPAQRATRVDPIVALRYN